MLSGLVNSRVMEKRIQIFNTGLYSLAITQHVVIVSRLVSGLEKSITIVYLNDTCRSTSIAERTPVHLVFNIPFKVNCNEMKKERIYLYFLAVNIGHKETDISRGRCHQIYRGHQLQSSSKLADVPSLSLWINEDQE